MWKYIENHEKHIILELRLLFVKKYEQIWTCFLVFTLMQENQHSQSWQRVAAVGRYWLKSILYTGPSQLLEDKCP